MPDGCRTRSGIWFFLAALLLIHVSLLSLTLTRRLDFLFNDATHRIGPGSDFYAFYNAGVGWREGRGPYGQGPGFGFRYLPGFAATIGVTLSLLPPKAAYAVWVCLLEMAFMLVLLILRMRWGATARFMGASLILVCFFPYYLEAYMGNASFLAAAILLLAFHVLTQGRHVFFALLLGFSILVKPIGIFLLPMLLLDRKHRLALYVAGVVCISSTPFFLADSRSLRLFVDLNFKAIPSSGWVVHAGNQGFHNLVTNIVARLAGISTAKLADVGDLPPIGMAIVMGFPLLLAGLSGVVLWRTQSNLPLGLFLWSSVYLLGYKDVWEHSYSFAVLPLIGLAESKVVSLRVLVPLAILIALPTGFFLYNLPLPPGAMDPEHYWSTPISIVHHATKSLPYLALYLAALLRLMFRRAVTTAPAADGPGAGAANPSSPRPGRERLD